MKKTENIEQNPETKKQRLTNKTVTVVVGVLIMVVALTIVAVCIVFNGGNTAAESTTVDSDELEEYRDTEDVSDYMATEEVTQLDDSQSVIPISWSVPEGYMKTTGTFYVEAGGEISIAVNVVGDQDPVYVGIVAPDGTRRYVYAQGLVMHTFEVKESGYYQMYIRNTASGEIMAEGSVAYED